jgi:uncharacterized membrane protein SpoIIM required for sporulation
MLHELPREYRASWPFLLAAFALMFIPLFAATLAVVVAPANAEWLVSPAELSEIKRGETWFASPEAMRSVMASIIMTHNLQVTFLALAGGMLAGVVTALVLVFNGISFGGIVGAMFAYGIGDQLFGFVSPHGFLELSVIVIAGACGLMLGKAIVWPGLQPRSVALQAAGARAIRLMFGSLLFLIIAGLFEGFVSPAEFPWPFKLAIGLCNAAIMYGYLLLVGREPKAPRGIIRD